MWVRDYRDLLGGALLLLTGGYASIYALTSLSIGTLNRMGPGMFPFIVGGLVALFGLALAIPALFRSGPHIEFDVRSTVVIALSILVFALTIRSFGLVPSILAMTAITSQADGKLAPLKVAILGVALAAIATAIFGFGWFRLQVPLFDWPW